MIIDPVAIADFMHKIRTGHSNLIPEDHAEVCGTIAFCPDKWMGTECGVQNLQL
jgi:hypothetical protein